MAWDIGADEYATSTITNPPGWDIGADEYSGLTAPYTPPSASTKGSVPRQLILCNTLAIQRGSLW